MEEPSLCAGIDPENSNDRLKQERAEVETYKATEYQTLDKEEIKIDPTDDPEPVELELEAPGEPEVKPEIV